MTYLIPLYAILYTLGRDGSSWVNGVKWAREYGAADKGTREFLVEKIGRMVEDIDWAREDGYPQEYSLGDKHAEAEWRKVLAELKAMG